MQECTPEIIIQAAKKADLCVHKISPENPAYLVSHKTNGKSFIASPWSLYPTQYSWQASIMRYKELSSRYLHNGGFSAVSGTYLLNDVQSPRELLKLVTDEVSKIGFPCVIKPNTGSLSRNIYIIRDSQELEDKMPTIHQNISELLIQKYSDQDEYRVFIHKGAILYIYKKQFIFNDGVTNRLAEAPLDQKYVLTSDFPAYLVDFAERLYAYTHADIIGLDIFLKDDIRSNQEPTILEINHNPGLGVMYETYNKKELVIEFLSGLYKNYLSK